MKIKIKNPPQGYRKKAEYRVPRLGEPIITPFGTVEKADSVHTYSVYIVLEKRLKGFKKARIPRFTTGWVARNKLGCWRWFNSKPHICGDGWVCNTFSFIIPSQTISGWRTPTHENWAKSLMYCGEEIPEC